MATKAPIKPSEAYRLGREKIPRWTNKAYISEGNKSACAIGAIGIGIGATIGDDGGIYNKTMDLFDRTGLEHVRIPYGCKHYTYLGDSNILDVIEHRSDYHRRTLGSDENIIATLEQYELN